MSKRWLVTRHDFKKHVFKKSFIFVLLSVPLFIAFMVGFIAISINMENNNNAVGYVDYSGLLKNPILLPGSDSGDSVKMIAFESQEDARMALEAGDIQAFYLLSDKYFETRTVELVYFEEPGENARSDFYDFMQINWAADLPPEIINRVSEGSNVIMRSPDGLREFPDGGPTLGQLLPFFINVAFIGLVLFSAGYMLEGVTEEKLNRTIEVVYTSLSPSELISGKVLAILGINLLQLITWLLVGFLAVIIAGSILRIEWFQNPSLPWETILMVAAIGALSYVIASALMLAIGSTVVEAQEGQALGGIFYMLFMSPLILIVVIGENPNGPVATILSITPFTALLTISLRNLFVSVPAWQYAASILFQLLFAIGAIWLATRAFQLGMLRYGQRLRLNEIFAKVKPSGVRGGEA
jgi:ABC-2 type transport system permease protein